MIKNRLAVRRVFFTFESVNDIDNESRIPCHIGRLLRHCAVRSMAPVAYNTRRMGSQVHRHFPFLAMDGGGFCKHGTAKPRIHTGDYGLV